MSLIETFKDWFRTGTGEEPLCPLPVGGEAIEFDDDEQAAVDSSLQEFYEDEIEAINNKIYQWVMDGRYTHLSSEMEIRRHDISDADAGDEKRLIDDWLRGETEVSYYLRGLKRAAYTRYGNGELVPAARTCIKALGVLLQSKRATRYSGDGEAEIWFMLSHMHASGGRFRVAKRLLMSAKETAKVDGDIMKNYAVFRPFPQDYNVDRSIWAAKVAALEQSIRSKTSPSPIYGLSEAEFRGKDGRIYVIDRVDRRD